MPRNWKLSSLVVLSAVACAPPPRTAPVIADCYALTFGPWQGPHGPLSASAAPRVFQLAPTPAPASGGVRSYRARIVDGPPFEGLAPAVTPVWRPLGIAGSFVISFADSSASLTMELDGRDSLVAGTALAQAGHLRADSGGVYSSEIGRSSVVGRPVTCASRAVVSDARPTPAGPCPSLGLADARDTTAYDEHAVSARPARIGGPPPRYPDELRRAGTPGGVVVEFIVGVDGRVEPQTVRVISTTNPAFNSTTVDAIRRSVFCPATIGSRPVRARITQPVYYRIAGQGSDPTASVVTYEPPRSVRIVSDPAGALVVVNARDTIGPAPGVQSFRRARRRSEAEPVLFEALPAESGQCRQAVLLRAEEALPSVVSFDMRRCPDPAVDLRRVFEPADLTIQPVWVGARPDASNGAPLSGRATVQYVIDTTGDVLMESVRVVDSTDASAARAARTQLSRWRFWPGRVVGEKVRTLVRAQEITFGTGRD